MTGKPPDEPPRRGSGARKDPVQVLVNALGDLPATDRDLVYAWLLRRGLEAGATGRLTSSVRVAGIPAAVLDPNLPVGAGAMLAQASGQQMVPVRFSSEQHAQLRQWCSEHGFSMATVIRGLVARFLEGQPPGSPGPQPA
jgi:hypothetical protein